MQVVEQQQERRGDSIVKSLSELRDIEKQRIADEIAALQREEAARTTAREAAERRVREEAEVRARAEREAQLAAEHARLTAEREERRRIDATAAAELARQQVALEAVRMDREHELRRAELARMRPTWMKVVMGLSLAAAGAMIVLALSSRSLAAEASERSRVALLDRDAAREESRQAREGLAALRRELEANSQAIQTALTELGRAKTAIQLAEVEAKLRREHDKAQALEDKRKRDEAAREKAIRDAGAVVPPECLHSTLCPGVRSR